MDNVINTPLLGTNAATTYFQTIPYDCMVKTVRAIAQNSDIGDADTVTLKNADGNTIGVATFGTDIAAGAKATYAADATYGNYRFSAGDVLTIVVSALDAAGDRVKADIELDPYALS